MVAANKLPKALILMLALLGIASASILLVFAEQEISPYSATFDRLSIASVIFLFWHIGSQRFRNQSIASPTPDTGSLKSLLLSPVSTPTDIGLLWISGITFSGSLSLWAWSLTQTSIANSTLLNNMMPIFATLGAWLFLSESFSLKFLLGMGAAISGAILIGWEDLQITNSVIGDAAALAAALLSAINILSVEQLRMRFETSWIMLWTCCIGSLVVMPIVFVTHTQFFPATALGWAAVLSLGAISQVLGQGLLTESLKTFSAGFVAVSMLSIPVIAAILARFIFDERLTLLNWSAFGLVLLGIYISISSQLEMSK